MPPTTRKYSDFINSETVVTQGRWRIILTRSIESNEIRLEHLDDTIQSLRTKVEELNRLVDCLLLKLEPKSSVDEVQNIDVDNDSESM